MLFQKGPTPIMGVQKGNWLQCPIILAKNDSYISKREMQLLTGLARTTGMSECLNIWGGGRTSSNVGGIISSWLR